MERSFLAFERTLMALLRTSMSRIAIGTAAPAIAVVQRKRRVDALRSMGLVPQWNLALAVAGVTVAYVFVGVLPVLAALRLATN